MVRSHGFVQPLEQLAPAGGPTDLVVLIGADGRRVGTAPKSSVHTTDTPLHLAFSIYVFDAGGRFLVTRRATSKITWPGVWTNSCCGHVRPDETPAAAATRRLGEELGLVATDLREVLPDFTYRATSAEGIVEHEVCPVFVARVEGDPVVDPDEIAEWHWSTWAGFRAVAQQAPWALSPWSVLQTAQLPAVMPPAVMPPA
jgi:isopentenyl-diphosphate delta-isomerase